MKKSRKKINFFQFFLNSSPRSNVGRVSSLKSHYLCPNSKVGETKGRYRAARAAKNHPVFPLSGNPYFFLGSQYFTQEINFFFFGKSIFSLSGNQLFSLRNSILFLGKFIFLSREINFFFRNSLFSMEIFFLWKLSYVRSCPLITLIICL